MHPSKRIWMVVMFFETKITNCNARDLMSARRLGKLNLLLDSTPILMGGRGVSLLINCDLMM